MAQATPLPALEPDTTIIEVDYQAGTTDPGRVFRSMAALIEAFNAIDRDLARAVSVSVYPEVLLERVEAGSVRAFLRTVLRHVDDDALKNLDWKPLVGQYLVKSKHAILRWLDGKDKIGSRTEVLELQREIAQLAPAAPHELLPAGTVPIDRLLEDVQSISIGVSELRHEDSAILISAIDVTPVEKRIRVTDDDIAQLLTQETTSTEAPMTLLVKKPDYLGNSKWEFKHGDNAIEARIVDLEWLARFQSGQVDLKPGDALNAIVTSEMALGFEGNLVEARHEIVKVLGVVPSDSGDQESLIISE
jgi:hypothetical protein